MQMVENDRQANLTLPPPGLIPLLATARWETWINGSSFCTFPFCSCLFLLSIISILSFYNSHLWVPSCQAWSWHWLILRYVFLALACRKPHHFFNHPKEPTTIIKQMTKIIKNNNNAKIKTHQK